MGTGALVTVSWLLQSRDGMFAFAGIGLLLFTFVLLIRLVSLVLNAPEQIMAVAHTVIEASAAYSPVLHRVAAGDAAAAVLARPGVLPCVTGCRRSSAGASGNLRTRVHDARAGLCNGGVRNT